MATTERELLLSLLKLTKNGLVSKDLVIKDAKIATQIAERILQNLLKQGLIEIKDKVIKTTLEKRVRIVIYALQHGADFERVCKLLDWKEFENIAATVFKANGYDVKRNFRFTHNGKRWEIDLLALKKPLVACVDCKHWRHGWAKSALVKAVEAQVERTKSLADALPNLYRKAGLEEWQHVTLMPIVLSLIPGPLKLHNNTPIVPILQLQSFINEMPASITFQTHFSKIVMNRNHKLTEF